MNGLEYASAGFTPANAGGGSVSSSLNKPPGEGTGPTIQADFRGKLVGRVPSRGEQDVFEPIVGRSYAGPCP